MSINILLITGASCAGKSYIKTVLNEMNEDEEIKFHDFDEKQGDLLDVADHFLELAKKYHQDEQTLVLCGGVLPSELKNTPKYKTGDYAIHGCLLTVGPEEHRCRLLNRTVKFFSITNLDNLPVENWISKYIISAEEYKEYIKSADSWEVVDNTIVNSQETIQKIWDWIGAKI